MLILFAIVVPCLLMLVGVSYTVGLYLVQRRALQTAADAASLRGSWEVLHQLTIDAPQAACSTQPLNCDAMVASSVLPFVTANAWPSSAQVASLLAYYVDANHLFVCSGGTAVQVGSAPGNRVPSAARGIQVTLATTVVTILPYFLQGWDADTPTATATGTATTTTLVLIPQAVNVC